MCIMYIHIIHNILIHNIYVLCIICIIHIHTLLGTNSVPTSIEYSVILSNCRWGSTDIFLILITISILSCLQSTLRVSPPAWWRQCARGE